MVCSLVVPYDTGLQVVLSGQRGKRKGVRAVGASHRGEGNETTAKRAGVDAVFSVHVVAVPGRADGGAPYKTQRKGFLVNEPAPGYGPIA